ncbi:MAG: hypothetical protein M3P93_00645, partial [Actinomycetota bacterium]|nr:hypothetical protein [Actinomycetota bacterium]
MFTGARVLGTLVLGAGLVAAAVAAPVRWRPLLGALGVVAVSLLPLWPLVYAVQWVPAHVAAGVFVLHGAGWIALGGAAPAARPAAAAQSVPRVR